jgi:hypothetical protein
VRRPQFPFQPPPPGFVWQPCVYQFDKSNLPALGSLTLAPGEQSGFIPLHLDKDAPFILHAIKVGDAGLEVQLWDPWGHELTDDFMQPAQYASDLLLTTLEGGEGIEVPAGSVFAVRLQGR